MKVRIKDIAAAAGCSMAQASRALNGCKGVDPETRKKILQTAGKLEYGRKKNSVVVLSPPGIDDWNVLCLKELQRNGINGVIMPFRHFTPNDEKFFDGAICANGADRIEDVWCPQFTIPLVMVNQYGSRLERIEAVQPDADWEMESAVGYLASLGHRHIARLHPVSLSAPQKVVNRGMDGFFSAAESFGIRHCVYNENYEPAGRIQVILPKLLREGFTAFIVVSDFDHQRLLNIFSRCRVRIPEDVSVIVYEQLRTADFNLTAIEIDNDLVVKRGIMLLKEKLAGKTIPSVTRIPGKFHVRGSAGRVRDA